MPAFDPDLQASFIFGSIRQMGPDGLEAGPERATVVAELVQEDRVLMAAGVSPSPTKFYRPAQSLLSFDRVPHPKFILRGLHSAET